jgi:putative transposase
VQQLRAHHPLDSLLRAAGLARSTFYYHVKALASGDRSAGMKARIKETYERHKGRYGYRRIAADLRQSGYVVNHKKVLRLMSELKLKSVIRVKKYRSWRGEVGRTAPNLLRRDFRASQPNQKWVTDVTEFNVQGEKLYLSPIMDLYNGEIIAWQMDRSPHFPLVGTMLDKALARLSPDDTPVLHSDQGWQYQMGAWRARLRAHGVTQSMSRRGNCLDNAAIESFFGTLKSECFHLQRFTSVEQLQKSLRQYIDYYNNERIKLRLRGLSPVEYRLRNVRPPTAMVA